MVVTATLLAALLAIMLPAARATDAITPMTPDGVESYDSDGPNADFIRRAVMIPMRDGVKLYTVIVMLKGTTGGPILLTRTPYDAKKGTERLASGSILDIVPVMDAEFVADHYIRVYQDIRGLHHSEGQYVTTRPHHRALEHHGHR